MSASNRTESNRTLGTDIARLMREGAQKELRAEMERKLNRIKLSADEVVINRYTRLSLEILEMEACLSDLKKLDEALKEIGEEDDRAADQGPL